MYEHARWFPTCPHIVICKGKDYVEKARLGEHPSISKQKEKVNQSDEQESSISRQETAMEAAAEFGYHMDWIRIAARIYSEREGPNSQFQASDLMSILMEMEDDPSMAINYTAGSGSCCNTTGDGNDVIADNMTSYGVSDAICFPNEYGPHCNFCIPHDTCTEGHYTCDVYTGNRLCLPGYTGVDCLTKIDTEAEVVEYHVRCPENECRNGGFCTSGRCCCNPGFKGDLCEVEIIECQNDSCLNGGICKDLVNGFKCLCKHGYSGSQCEVNITAHAQTQPPRDSNCQSRTCMNNGTCFELDVFVYCVCPLWFSGDNCEKDMRPSGMPIFLR
ncbi:FBP1-like protein [Mya arenaria]|uniref:FBP1-like protein n=1 Tax=Mya arenaria TaxID=6604 RepID=A0ABY7G990_MYAAR|nr:FBP1-like protein [Mya arenaria]